MVSIGSIKSKPDDIHTLMSHPFEDNAQRFRDLLRKHGVDAENDEKQTPLQYAMYNMDGEDTLKYIRVCLEEGSDMTIDIDYQQVLEYAEPSAQIKILSLLLEFAEERQKKKNSLKLGLKKVRWEAMKEKILKINPQADIPKFKIRTKSETMKLLTLPIQIVSLKCPILKSKNIKTPVVFRQCEHLAFFDADNFRKSRLTKCPICGKAGTVDDLELLEFFVDIVDKDSYIEKIKIDAEGNVLPANGMSVNQIAAIKSEPIENQAAQFNSKGVPSKSITTVGSLVPQRNKSARANRRGKTASEEEAEREHIKNSLSRVERENSKLKEKLSLMEKYIGSVLFGREKKIKDLLNQKMKANKDLLKEVSKLKQEKLELIKHKQESGIRLKEANEVLSDQKSEFELEKIKLKSELKTEHQEAIKQLEERMQKELAPKNTERMDLANKLLEKMEEVAFVQHKSKRSKKRSRSRSSSRSEKVESKHPKTELKHKLEHKPSSSSRNEKQESDSIPGLGGNSSQDDSIICIDD